MSPGRVSWERLTRVTDLFAIAGQLSPSTAVLTGGSAGTIAEDVTNSTAVRAIRERIRPRRWRQWDTSTLRIMDALGCWGGSLYGL